MRKLFFILFLIFPLFVGSQNQDDYNYFINKSVNTLYNNPDESIKLTQSLIINDKNGNNKVAYQSLISQSYSLKGDYLNSIKTIALIREISSNNNTNYDQIYLNFSLADQFQNIGLYNQSSKILDSLKIEKDLLKNETLKGKILQLQAINFAVNKEYPEALKLFNESSTYFNEISEENIDRMCDAMKAFSLLMKVHKVEQYKAFATSAMREAYNGKEVTEIIKKKTGIKIEIIDGKKEAAIIASSDLHSLIKTEKTYLFVDVGGGSTEFTLFSDGKMIVSRSFKAGTVRLLNDMVHDVVWEEIEKWIRTNTEEYDEVTLIGSGGNINKLFKMSAKSQDKPLSYIYMNSQYAFLNSLTYEQRISELGLNSDRADVIIPATRIYLNAMKWSGARNIYVPKIGLADGIVKAMYYGKI